MEARSRVRRKAAHKFENSYYHCQAHFTLQKIIYCTTIGFLKKSNANKHRRCTTYRVKPNGKRESPSECKGLIFIIYFCRGIACLQIYNVGYVYIRSTLHRISLSLLLVYWSRNTSRPSLYIEI